ncbi:MAG: hypothetical protein Q4C13_05565 [Clostridia bacterium]|nr:hypothetical protein [Clostridia bacterium]
MLHIVCFLSYSGAGCPFCAPAALSILIVCNRELFRKQEFAFFGARPKGCGQRKKRAQSLMQSGASRTGRNRAKSGPDVRLTRSCPGRLSAPGQKQSAAVFRLKPAAAAVARACFMRKKPEAAR